MSNRSLATARVLFWAQGLNSLHDDAIVHHIRGVLKTFGLLPSGMRGLPFDRKVEALILDRSDVAPIVRPMLVAWRQLREQIAAFDKAIRVLVRSNSACRLLMSVPASACSLHSRCKHS
jgi:transposase